jgi:hypothetical protein
MWECNPISCPLHGRGEDLDCHHHIRHDGLQRCITQRIIIVFCDHLVIATTAFRHWCVDMAGRHYDCCTVSMSHIYDFSFF